MREEGLAGSRQAPGRAPLAPHLQVHRRPSRVALAVVSASCPYPEHFMECANARQTSRRVERANEFLEANGTRSDNSGVKRNREASDLHRARRTAERSRSRNLLSLALRARGPPCVRQLWNASGKRRGARRLGNRVMVGALTTIDCGGARNGVGSENSADAALFLVERVERRPAGSANTI